MKWLLVWVLMLGVCPRAVGSYYDWQDADRKAAYDLLEQVEKEVGVTEFDSIPHEFALAFALPLGRLDRDKLTSAAMLGHLQRVTQARKRFYRAQQGLTDEEAVAWLLPFRIRYEPTSKPDWLMRTGQHFEKITAKAKTADGAAVAVLSWMNVNLELVDPARSYRLPLRGDLDPLSVLKGGRGTEIDLAICGVAALRASGIAARIVWAPVLRGEAGGKVWLEYLNEAKMWQPWVPSLRRKLPHRDALRKDLGGKIVFVMARPEEPEEITATYAATVEIEFQPQTADVDCSLMVIGSQGLLPARGNGTEMMRNERILRIGRGPAIAVASFGDSAFALLPFEIPSTAARILIQAGDAKLSTIKEDDAGVPKISTHRSVKSESETAPIPQPSP